MRRRNYFSLAPRVFLAVLALAATSIAGDFPHWRGPYQRGVTNEKELPSTWSTEGENLIWEKPYGCRSAPVVLNDRVYLINRVGEGESRQERVMALDLDSGEIVWEHRFNVFLTDIVFHRVGWANIIADPETGYIYAHGIQGMLFCFDRDGNIIWKRSLTEELGRISGYGGRTNSPIIEDDLVIISSLTSGWGPHGKGLHRFLAMDKRTGEVRWWSEPSGKPLDTTYSVPVTATLDGLRVMFTGLADGTIVAMRPSTGEKLWQFTLSKRGINSSVVYGNGRVYATHSEENIDSTTMGRLVCLDARTGEEVWRQDGLTCGYASPVLHTGLLFVPDNSANLHCLDAQTGERFWKFNYGNEGKGSPVLADGKIYIGDVGGAWNILSVSRKSCEQLGVQHFKTDDGSPDEVYASPAIAHGRVILPTMHRLYCISTVSPTYRSEAKDGHFSATSAATSNTQARIQIVPAETWVQPGEEIAFRIRATDADGAYAGDVLAPLSVKGLEGKTNSKGVFVAGGDRIQAGTIEASLGGLETSSRVRIVPKIPYAENFEELKPGLPPSGWITSKLKCQVSEFEGGKVLRKLADRPAPPFARLRCYVMPPLDAGYTVSSDLLGMSKKERFLPDMGLINSRYLLILTGTTERKRMLRLVSWAPVPRIIKEVDFPWEGDTWYRAKLSVHVADDRGVVRAKVWQREKDEPESWSLLMIDSSPNREGSPGLYAYSVSITSKSKGTEVLFDNVEINPN